MIRTSFGFDMGSFRPEHRLFANDTAGGGILDVGGYPVSMARLIAGVAAGKPFLDPDKVTGVAHLGQTGVDEWASAVLQLPERHRCGGVLLGGGATGQYAAHLRHDGPHRGERFLVRRRTRGRHRPKIEIVRHDGTSETIAVEEPRHLWTFEVDAVGEAIRAGRQELAPPGMGWADTLGNMRVLDRWRARAGLVYDIEKPARRTKTLAGGPSVRGNSAHRDAAGARRPTSEPRCVALGFEFFPHVPSASILLDAFYERGRQSLRYGLGLWSGQDRGGFRRLAYEPRG